MKETLKSELATINKMIDARIKNGKKFDNLEHARITTIKAINKLK